MHTRICRMCGKPFAAEKTEAVYCPDCSPKARAATVIRERTCMDCGAPIMGSTPSNTCSDACRAIRKRERLAKNQAAYRQRKKEAANNAD